jgi:hypothetical protein
MRPDRKELGSIAKRIVDLGIRAVGDELVSITVVVTPLSDTPGATCSPAVCSNLSPAAALRLLADLGSKLKESALMSTGCPP